eukprot:Partr_v1_DN27167_c1_g1_i4_m15665 putative Aldehyde dehydrogenase
MKHLNFSEYARPFIAGDFQATKQLSKSRLLKFPSRINKNFPHDATIHECEISHVDQSVSIARQVFPAWSDMSYSRKRDILNSIADTIDDHANEMAELEALNVGKPLAEALFDVKDASNVFRYFAGFADKIYGQTYQFNRRYDTATMRKPVGVCSIITSFNYPLSLSSWKLAPALACGNACILKPHQDTPLSVLYLAQLIKENTELPPGVLSVLPGGVDIGRHITEHPDIDKCSFTGSPSVGREVMAASARSNLKRVTLELGGKSPLMVFDDVQNLESCANDIVGAIFSNSGQNCCAGSRLFIHRRVYDDLLRILETKCKEIVVGDPMDSAVTMGPIVSMSQYERINRIISAAKKRNIPSIEGMTLPLESGNFIPPTIFYNVPDTDELATEEIFGPVLSVMEPFGDDNSVIARANKCEFGLASGVWTSNLHRAQRLEMELEAGTV